MLRQPPVQHIRQKLQEAEYFLGGIRHFSQAIDELVARGLSPFTPGGFPLVRKLQYHLSAMLSAFQCVLNYMEKECTSESARCWYKRVDGQKLIEAFGALRHSDVHNETVGTTHQTTVVPGISRRSDMMLSAEALSATKDLGSRSKVLKVLTSRPIIDLATDAYELLARAVNEGQEKRLFASLPPLPTPTVRQTLSKNPPRTLDDYLRCGAMDEFSHKVLRDAVVRRRVVCIRGEHGSGKTSLLHAIIREYHASEGDGVRVTLLGEGFDELCVSVPSLHINAADRTVSPDADTDTDLRWVVFADGGGNLLEAALPLWQAGSGGAFTTRDGDSTMAMRFNAVAPVCVIMVEGTITMLLSRGDEDLDQAADRANEPL